MRNYTCKSTQIVVNIKELEETMELNTMFLQINGKWFIPSKEIMEANGYEDLTKTKMQQRSLSIWKKFLGENSIKTNIAEINPKPNHWGSNMRTSAFLLSLNDLIKFRCLPEKNYKLREYLKKCKDILNQIYPPAQEEQPHFQLLKPIPKLTNPKLTNPKLTNDKNKQKTINKKSPKYDSTDYLRFINKKMFSLLDNTVYIPEDNKKIIENLEEIKNNSKIVIKMLKMIIHLQKEGNDIAKNKQKLLSSLL